MVIAPQQAEAEPAQSSSLAPSASNSTGLVNGVNDSQQHSSVNFHPLLIYSIRYEIRSYDLFHLSTGRSHQNSQTTHQMQSTNALDAEHNQHGSKHARTLIAGLKNTIGLDFYYVSDSDIWVFWIDVIEERIYRGFLANSTITNAGVVLQHGLATAEGLAIDWIGHNIYWVESTLDHIEVASLDGSSRRTLIAGDMDSPRAIAVDPRYGYMFWSDWDKRNPRIERATMSGEQRQVLVNIKSFAGNWPNGITLDYENLRVYWIDANSDSIHSVDYDGNNHQDVLSNIKSLGHPFSISLYEDNVFWTDWKTNSVSMANKHSGSDARELQRLTSRLFDIKVLHPSRQPQLSDESLNPCAIKNGGCSHLCLLSTNHGRRCECPHLMKLSSDGTSCEPWERVLLIGKTTEIRAVDFIEPLHNVMAPIGAPKVFSPRQIEFDAKSKTIFWVDSQTNEVKRAQLASSGLDTIIDVIIESPSGLALDWVSGNIYVTSAPQQKAAAKIFISNLNGEFISILMDGPSSGLVSPRSIAVHPILGLLFCIDDTTLPSAASNKDSTSASPGTESIIFMANMDGTNKTIAVSKSNNPRLSNPTSLAVDYELNRLYWINQVTSNSTRANNSVQYLDIGTGKIVTVIDGEAPDSLSSKVNPSVLCVDGDNLIISGRLEGEPIIKVPKSNISNASILINRSPTIEQVSALRVYNASTQAAFQNNSCSLNNGGCSQLCVPTANSNRVCKCTIGYVNDVQNPGLCVGKDKFLIYSSNFGMKGISLELNSAPDETFLPPIHRAFRASSIDYVYKDNIIYWVDNEDGCITRINRDTTNYQVIVHGLESEESIAVDWIAGNIYWLDPYYDIIEVARLNGSDRYVIASGEMDKANGIVVNPLSGYIVWSDVGTFPKIERANMDGSNRKTIVTNNLVHIDDLTIDYRDDYIYWIDSTSATVERIRDDGTMRKVVFRANYPSAIRLQQSNLVSLAIYENYLYVADSMNQGSIMRFDKNNATNVDLRVVPIQSNLGDGIRDIAVFAPQPMPEGNPCGQNNGGCQDLCLFMGKAGRKRCICSHGKLKPDRLTCEPYDTFVLFSKLTQIDSLHIRGDESPFNAPYPPITTSVRSSIISLTVDYPARRVIYSEMAHDQICSVFFNGTDRRVLVEKQSLVEGIAFASNQLYWTSIHDNSISRLNTSSSGVLGKVCDDNWDTNCRTATVEKIIKLGADDKPRGITIDKCTSTIYWTNWNARSPSIQRANPEKNFKVETIIDTQIKVPNGITIDHQLRRIYWCDARLDKIEYCDMNGLNRAVLIHALPQHPFALITWDNYVLWTDWLARGVYKADKFTGLQLTQIKKVVQRPMGIAVAAEESLVCPDNLCAHNNGGCDENHTCIMHHLYGKKECRPNELVIHQDKSLPQRFHHPLYLGACKPGVPCRSLPAWQLPVQDYHDTLRDALDRFSVNASDIFFPSSGPSAKSYSTSLIDELHSMSPFASGPWQQQGSVPQQAEPQPHSGGSNNNQVSHQQLEDDGLKPMQPTTNRPTTSSSSSGSSTAQQQLAEATRAPDKAQPTPASSSTQVAPVISTDLATSSPTNATTISTSTGSSTELNGNSTEKQQPPSRNSGAPSNTSSTVVAPCQIVPAALQTTTDSTSSSSTDCKTQLEFKCYLSEKLLCIASDKRCDGISDCPSKEDENDCPLSKRGSYTLQRESNWHRYVTVMLIILAATLTALFLVFGTKKRRRWFVGTNGAFNHRRMLDDNGTNIEISNPMFDEDDGSHVHCAFSIDLNERTTNFSNPLYERQFLLMNDKRVTSG